MSNIPNSAMPHAWADEDEEDDGLSEGQIGLLGGLAIAGGLAALLYFVFARK